MTGPTLFIDKQKDKLSTVLPPIPNNSEFKTHAFSWTAWLGFFKSFYIRTIQDYILKNNSNISVSL